MTEDLPTEDDAKKGLDQPDQTDAESPSIHLEQTHDVRGTDERTRTDPVHNDGGRDRDDRLLLVLDRLAATIDRFDQRLGELERPGSERPMPPGTDNQETPPRVHSPSLFAEPVPSPAPAARHPEMVQRTPEDPQRQPLEIRFPEQAASPAASPIAFQETSTVSPPQIIQPSSEWHPQPKPMPAFPKLEAAQRQWQRAERAKKIKANYQAKRDPARSQDVTQKEEQSPSAELLKLVRQIAEMTGQKPPEPAAPTIQQPKPEQPADNFQERRAEFRRTGIPLRRREAMRKRGIKLESPQTPKARVEQVGDGLKKIEQGEKQIESKIGDLPKPEPAVAPSNDGVLGVLQAILAVLMAKPVGVTQPAAPAIPVPQPAPAVKQKPAAWIQVPHGNRGQTKWTRQPKPKQPPPIKLGLFSVPDEPPGAQPEPKPGEVPPVADAARQMAASVQEHAAEVNHALAETVQALGDVARVAMDATAAARAAGEMASRIGQAVQEMASSDNSRLQAQRSGSA